MESIVVLAIVVVALLYYVDQCRRLRAAAGTEFRGLLRTFLRDIKARAQRGQDPDWRRYTEEGERRHESLCESMRNLATTALATGVGGTMAMLLMHFWFDNAGGLDAASAPGGGAIVSGEAAELDALFRAMGFALLASGSGVVANLVILLRFLRSANAQFERQRTNFMKVLQKASDESPPQNIMTRLTGQLGERLDEVLHTSAQSFPGMIRAFNDNAGALATVAQRFDESSAAMNSGVSSLSATIEALDAWAADAAKAQRAYLAELRTVVEAHGSQVRQALEVLEAWRVEMAATEERRRELWIEEQRAHDRAIRDLANTTTDVATAAEGLAAGFAEEIRRGADVLGREFGTRAQHQVADLISALQDQNDALGAAWERHVNRMLDQMGGIVHEGLAPTLEGISGIGANLERVGGDVRRAVGEFADHSQGFRSSLEGAATTIDDSSARLAEAHEVTRTSVAGLEETHARIADSLDRMESASLAKRGWVSRLRRWIGR